MQKVIHSMMGHGGINVNIKLGQLWKVSSLIDYFMIYPGSHFEVKHTVTNSSQDNTSLCQ
jgi:hypothetical protein